MKNYQIFKYIEDWAPVEIAWERDNVGLQVGSPGNEAANILLCLELTGAALDEALKKGCNLIITHHPFLFHPIKKLNFSSDKNSQLIQKLIQNGITLYSAHTNLDFTKDGVSFEIAKILGLKNIDFLQNISGNQFKLSVFVPKENIDKVSEAIFNAGGGVIGEYSGCSFRTIGTGTFKGSENSDPAIGKKGSAETVEEIKLEILINSWKLKDAIKALIDSHPYEEPAYDIYPLANKNINYGIGAIGEFENEINEEDFFKIVSGKLGAKNFRFARGKKDSIKKVAVCGGSGSDYMKAAISSKADAFVTADCKYHNFHDANGEILLIDAGHYETEIHSFNEMKKRLDNFLEKNNQVFIYSGSTNPIIFYNN